MPAADDENDRAGFTAGCTGSKVRGDPYVGAAVAARAGVFAGAASNTRGPVLLVTGGVCPCVGPNVRGDGLPKVPAVPAGGRGGL